MEKDEPFYFRAGKLYRLIKLAKDSDKWTPIYKDRTASSVVGKYYEGGIFLFTGNVWVHRIQIIHEECTGWISTHFTMQAEEIKED